MVSNRARAVSAESSLELPSHFNAERLRTHAHAAGRTTGLLLVGLFEERCFRAITRRAQLQRAGASRDSARHEAPHFYKTL